MTEQTQETQYRTTVAEKLSSAKESVWRMMIGLVSEFVYLGMIIYAEVHGLSMLREGVAEDMKIFAYVGMVGLGLTAYFLPKALKHEFKSSGQRAVGFLFYAVDVGLLIANAVIDFIARRYGSLPEWGTMYMQFGVPMTPIVAGMIWGVLGFMDPEVKAKIRRFALEMAVREAYEDEVMEAAKDAALNQDISAAARIVANGVTLQVLGVEKSRRLTALPASQQVIDVQARDAEPAAPVVKNDWFARIPRVNQTAKAVYNAATANAVNPGSRRSSAPKAQPPARIGGYAESYGRGHMSGPPIANWGKGNPTADQIAEADRAARGAANDTHTHMPAHGITYPGQSPETRAKNAEARLKAANARITRRSANPTLRGK